MTPRELIAFVGALASVRRNQDKERRLSSSAQGRTSSCSVAHHLRACKGDAISQSAGSPFQEVKACRNSGEKGGRLASVIGRNQRRRRSGQSSADPPSVCVPFRRSYCARDIADAVKIGRLAVAYAFDLLMHLRHLGLAEVRRLTDRQRMDIHLR
jgi:hypothetical protein